MSTVFVELSLKFIELSLSHVIYSTEYVFIFCCTVYYIMHCLKDISIQGVTFELGTD